MSLPDPSAITDREDFLSFLAQLRADFASSSDGWENPTLEQFLEAVEAWLTDSSPDWERTAWQALATALRAGRDYE